MLIILMIGILATMTMSPSPLKLSLLLTYISILLGMMSYKLTTSILATTVVMISFSSGMMILFSYCSMMSLHKDKSPLQKKSWIILSTLPVLLTYSSTKTSPITMSKNMMESFNSTSLVFVMMMVIISMVGINTSFFNPTKKLMMSY